MADSEKVNESEEDQTLDISMLDTYSLMGLFLNLLTLQAWRDIGLRADPKSNEIITDFTRANVAIDCIGFLAEKLEPKIGPEETAKIKSFLTDLQINYVQQSEKPAESSEKPAEP